jgi:hypothetical protein
VSNSLDNFCEPPFSEFLHSLGRFLPVAVAKTGLCLSAQVATTTFHHVITSDSAIIS